MAQPISASVHAEREHTLGTLRAERAGALTKESGIGMVVARAEAKALQNSF